MKKTKIVATLGPASSDREVIKEMMLQGMDVCRLNFSHGQHEDYKTIIKTIRSLNEELNKNTAILADLQGPKLRIGAVENDCFSVKPGDEVVFSTQEKIGTKEHLYITYEEFARDVKKGEKVLLDDGKVVLKVISTNGKDEVKTEVLYGAEIKSKKGVNLPNTRISLPCLTEKDLVDLEFALQEEIDWIGLSFVRSARDIIELKHIVKGKRSNTKIVAKIEKPEAIDDIDDIMKATDGIMVARGDLGVEIPLQNVPMIQKSLIVSARRHAKPVIVATQMMESMIEDITPTRAEVNDVANAVLDGADAVMLSGETSVGKHPVEVISTMTSIIHEVEQSDTIYHKEEVPEKNQERFISDSICFNAVRLGQRVNTQAIITMTFSGYTAYKISSQRPKAPIFVFTGNKKILTQLNLVWGVIGFYYDKMVSTDHTITDIKYILKKGGYLKDGDIVINIVSIPIEEKGKSNTIKLSYVE